MADLRERPQDVQLLRGAVTWRRGASGYPCERRLQVHVSHTCDVFLNSLALPRDATIGCRRKHHAAVCNATNRTCQPDRLPLYCE